MSMVEYKGNRAHEWTISLKGANYGRADQY